MSEIIFKRNNPKYIYFILILIIMIASLLYFGILWSINPSKYIFWLMPNKVIIFCVGVLSIICSLILSYLLTKSIFNRKFFIRIDEIGLFLGIIQYSNKLIYWNDITHIERIKINGTQHIMIFIKNIDYYQNQETGIQKYFFTSTNKKYGTPFVINVNALSPNFNAIIKSIMFSWEEYKK